MARKRQLEGFCAATNEGVDLPLSHRDDLAFIRLVALGRARVLVPASRTNLTAACRAEGLTVYDPDVSMIGNGGGAVHCMWQALKRDRAGT